MRSTFSGLETAKRGMFTQQSALYTTGHNISNANTPGYTRQRINFQTTTPYPSVGMNRPQIPGQMGTGVEAGSVQRIRNDFLDLQFRGKNSDLGYWQSRADSLSKLENVLNEPSENGLSKVMGEFWKSLEILSTNPENEGARVVVLESAQAVADTFHHLHSSITEIREDLGYQAETTVKDVNSILTRINDLNQQIKDVETHGYLPNDLYDDRDRLVDELSQHLNIEVEKVESGGANLAIADGLYNINVVNADGTKIPLIDANTSTINQLTMAEDADGNITISANGSTLDSEGQFKALVEANNNDYPKMLDALDKMAKDFATAFNDVHDDGIDLNGDQGGPFFSVSEGASDISVVIVDSSKIAASSNGDAGDGENALNLANVQHDAGIISFFEGTIGSLGVQARAANRQLKSSIASVMMIEGSRQSISSVSLDEEMTNLIKYQHAYNAAARNITVVDEMLDKVINGMGVVGR
ncbi:flagellar hook-associated protein FlgK [Bacillus sp. Hm123]|uniref:flagellar hook-associated protein FlgK n=1 Tax=Bacillus sp. Hm123 TaxID=3450745 RepID=UPI003F423765